jgi:hypothetical protein
MDNRMLIHLVGRGDVEVPTAWKADSVDPINN